MASTLGEKTTHVVVDFAVNIGDQRNIDLVPRSWLTYANNKWKCAFPQAKEYGLLKSWVSQSFHPKPSWKYYRCKVVKEAGNYEQGVRRLNRAIASDVIESSTDMEIDDSNRPIILQDKALENELKITQDTQKNRVSKRKKLMEPSQTVSDTDSPQTKKIKEIVRIEVQKELNKTESNIISELAKLGRRFQYDLKKETNSVRSTIVANTSCSAIESDREVLGVTFPIDNFEEFQKYDADLVDKSKAKAFKHYLRVEHCRAECRDTCLRKILESIISKSVQLKYSACGKAKGDVAKYNFSATNSYRYISEFLYERYANDDDAKELISVLSRWFSGAPDREGGRKLREKN